MKEVDQNLNFQSYKAQNAPIRLKVSGKRKYSMKSNDKINKIIIQKD